MFKKLTVLQCNCISFNTIDRASYYISPKGGGQ